jgi:hypothetical protein
MDPYENNKSAVRMMGGNGNDMSGFFAPVYNMDSQDVARTGDRQGDQGMMV